MAFHFLNIYNWHTQKCFLNPHKFRADVKAPSNRGSHCTLPVLIHNDSILWQLLLDQYDFLLTFHDKISPCKKKSQRILIVMTNWYNLFSLCLFFCIPGSSGHSLSFANSMGVFPVSTQLELRNIIGILQKQNTIKNINKKQTLNKIAITILKIMSNLDLNIYSTFQLGAHCGWFSDYLECIQCLLWWVLSRSYLWDDTVKTDRNDEFHHRNLLYVYDFKSMKIFSLI